LGVGLFFSWDTLGIERIIRNKMVCLGFLSYSTNIDLPFRAPNFNLWVGGFLCHFKKKKINSEDTIMPPRRKIYMCSGASPSFSFFEIVQI
jgi:hypothetical protein